MLVKAIQEKIVFFILLFVAANLYADTDESCLTQVGHLATVEGQIEVQRNSGTIWKSAAQKDVLCKGDTVRAGDLSRATIQLINQAVLRLNQNSAIRLTDVIAEAEKKSIIALLKGAFQSLSRKPRGFTVNTPYLNGSIEGTEFVFEVAQGQSTLTVLEGAVLASNEFGHVMVNSGQAATAKLGSGPIHSIVVNPRDAVQWAMYYPPVLAGFGGQAEEKKQALPDTIVQTVELIKQGDAAKALKVLDSMPVSERNEKFFTYRAALFLSVGQVDDAEINIKQAIEKNANDSDALALSAIIAITRNENKKALELAKQATQMSPDSSSALIALSYTQQAQFDLDAAKSSLHKAVKLDPENALAWARLAALYSASGEIKKTYNAAEKASVLAPELSLTQTVLGFAYLTQVNIDEAKTAFNKAIELSQADPLPRLGLGLAKIREGDLAEGGRDIEVAVNLGPNISIFRSYLGKTYYEQKRSYEIVDEQYLAAKELDPNDPTPYFYSSIEKQTTNRPVEALEDAQKAIELNDNRAVYRSKLLLDSDLASRSAAIARIYTDLGFQRLSLVEGWKSVNTDPSDFSSHRLLADSYSVLPRHEIARVSELLQSQLLQPINTTPIQPRLAESNLLLISAGGPGATSFNEFNPLFNSNGLTFQGNALVGGNDTYGGEGIVSGIYDQVSFSLGYNHFQTNGWRENADQKDDIANAFVQWEISPQTSLQAEYRNRRKEVGDVELNFFTEDFRPNFSTKDETNSIRIGLRHAFSPSSIVLGSVIYQHLDGSLNDNPNTTVSGPGGSTVLIDSIDGTIDTDSVTAELQYLFRSHYFNAVFGGGIANVYGDQEINPKGKITIPVPFPPFSVSAPLPNNPTKVDLDVKHQNLYLYTYINPVDNLTLTIGGSADFYSAKSELKKDASEFNPKFGITWNPLPGTTLRAAAFKALKRTLVTNQTLEPTQVAGFNQFYDDIDATDSWHYGGAVDQKFLNTLYGGLQFSKRDLNVPVFTTGNQSGEGKWDEYFGRAYLFWTPHPWVSLSTEYQYEQFERDDDFAPRFKKVTTHQVPLGLKFFHPTGFNFTFQASYYNQDGEFRHIDSGTYEKGSDDFWLLDTSIGYRLPKRYGFITVGVKNLLDKKFNYQETNFNNPTIQPDRVIFSNLTLSF